MKAIDYVNPSHATYRYIRIADLASKSNEKNIRYFIYHQPDKCVGWING